MDCTQPMNFNEDSNNSDWVLKPLNEEKVKKKKDPNNSTIKKPKESRRFSDKWFDLYSPWLDRDKESPDKPFCKACQTRLDNNKFRITRHQNTAKHVRNLEILMNSGEGAVIELFNNKLKKKKFREGRIKKEPKTIPFDTIEYVEETPLYEPKFNPKKRIIMKSEFSRHSPPRTPIENVDLDLHFKDMKRERCDMKMRNYYYAPPQPKKDSFDMFFDAISATVKALPPKLAAEVKSRISQLIAEFELRAICEKEALEKAQQHNIITTIPTQVVTVSDPILTAGSSEKQTSDGNTVTQYVYSYQSKI